MAEQTPKEGRSTTILTAVICLLIGAMLNRITDTEVKDMLIALQDQTTNLVLKFETQGVETESSLLTLTGNQNRNYARINMFDDRITRVIEDHQALVLRISILENQNDQSN